MGPAMTRTKLEKFRARCGLTARVIWTLAAGAGVLAVLNAFAGLPLGGPETARKWAQALIRFLPHGAYVYALFALGAALHRIAGGGLFQPAIVLGLRHAGTALAAGGLYSLFALTNLLRAAGAIEGSYLHFDMAGLALALTGAALILLADLISRAGRLEAELDEIV